MESNQSIQRKRKRRKRAKEIYNPVTHDYTIVKPEQRDTPRNEVRVRIRKKSFRNTRARADFELLKGIDIRKVHTGGQPSDKLTRRANERRAMNDLLRGMLEIFGGTK